MVNYHCMAHASSIMKMRERVLVKIKKPPTRSPAVVLNYPQRAQGRKKELLRRGRGSRMEVRDTLESETMT
jgi:hypothetical protein